MFSYLGTHYLTATWLVTPFSFIKMIIIAVFTFKIVRELLRNFCKAGYVSVITINIFISVSGSVGIILLINRLDDATHFHY